MNLNLKNIQNQEKDKINSVDKILVVKDLISFLVFTKLINQI